MDTPKKEAPALGQWVALTQELNTCFGKLPIGSRGQVITANLTQGVWAQFKVGGGKFVCYPLNPGDADIVNDPEPAPEAAAEQLSMVEEHAYMRGARSVWRRVLSLALGHLSEDKDAEDPPEVARARAVSQLEDTRVAVRDFWQDYGDGAFDPNLHLADVVSNLHDAVNDRLRDARPGRSMPPAEESHGRPAMKWREIKAIVDRMTEEQLDMEVIWSGEEQGGYVVELAINEEDQIDPSGEGMEPRSYYEKEYQRCMDSGDTEGAAEAKETFDEEEIVCVKGQPLLLVD